MTTDKDIFGSVLRQGTNLSVLSGAKKFFQERHDVSIISYEYTRDCGTRLKKFLKPEDLKKCDVCGMELYRLDVDSKADQEPEIYAKQKQYFRFTDTEGNHWHSCFKLNQCYTRVSFDPSWATTEASCRMTPPPFERFVNLSEDEPMTEELESLLEEMRKTYEQVVLPFIVEWGNKEITKANVSDFIRALRDTENVWHTYFEGRGVNKAMNKILTHIGVRP